MPTSDLVGAIAEADVEDVVDGAVGVEQVGAAVVADEAVLAPQHQHRAVDQLQGELLILPCAGAPLSTRGGGPMPGPPPTPPWHLPTVSLTAASCPFFLVQTYRPLLARRATRRPRHSMSNMVLAALAVEGECELCPSQTPFPRPPLPWHGPTHTSVATAWMPPWATRVQ